MRLRSRGAHTFDYQLQGQRRALWPRAATALKWVLLLALLLAGVLALQTWRMGSRQLQVPPAPVLAVDEQAAGESLGVAIRARTVSSRQDAALNTDQFVALQAHLRTRYPRVHATLKREMIGGLSLLYRWPGSDEAAKGIGLMAHQDVVDVAPGTQAQWQQAPFAGTLDDGFVWGRGSWDNKAHLVAQLEAVEMLLASGYQPRRTIYLIFGADQQVGGLRGALAIATLMAERKITLDFLVNEGLLISEGVWPGLKPAAALIGVAEKGTVSVLLKLPATQGQESMPPAPGSSAIAVMSTALTRLEAAQRPASLRGVAREMLETLAPEMSGFSRVALSNLWLFGPWVAQQLAARAGTHAQIRTTTAVTRVNAGQLDDGGPGAAEATLNFRLLPGDSQAGLLQQVRNATRDGPFELVVLPGAAEPSKVTPTDSDSYRLINRTVRELFPGTVVAPGLMVASTDSRHFAEVAEHIYRFSPLRAKPEDLARVRGTDERISLSNLAQLIRFYHRLIEQGAK